MLKQSPSRRNLRVAGRRCKVKHVCQICIVLVVSLWMLYQLKHCYFNKGSFNGGTELDNKAVRDKVVGKLGRKGLAGLVEVEDQEEEEEDEVAKGGDEFEQVDDLMEEIDEQEVEEMDDKELEIRSDDVLAEKLKKRSRTDVERD